MASDSVFEFLKSSFFNTSTQLTVNNNTATGVNLLNPDTRIQYYSEGLNDDNTTCSFTIAFSSTLSVSRIAIREMNWKKFNIYYNGSTANALSLTSTGSTISSQFITNSETSMFLRSTAVNCTSLTFDIYSTQVTNDEKAIGSIYLTEEHFTAPRRAAAGDYTPRIDPEQVVHQMSDGGIRIHTVKDKQSASLKYSNITTAFRNDLRDLYELRTSFIFCPMGTTTAWDGIIFEALWPGSFEFFKFSDNAAVSGHSGSINLKEVST